MAVTSQKQRIRSWWKWSLNFLGFFFFLDSTEQRNILNDTAEYNQQNPDYGQTTGQKIVSSLKKKIKEKKLQGKRER